MRTPPLLADFSHARACKPFCENSLTLPVMTILPAISFDGTTANCRVSVSADRSTDQISAVIQLWNGSTRIARWTDSGTGYLLFSNSATVSKGKTYELTVDVKINGVSKPQVSIEGTCK